MQAILGALQIFAGPALLVLTGFAIKSVYEDFGAAMMLAVVVVIGINVIYAASRLDAAEREQRRLRDEIEREQSRH